MKLTKNQKMLVGVGAVAVLGYMLWKKQQTSFTGSVRQKNAVGTSKNPVPRCPQCTTECGAPIPYNPNTGMYAPNGVCLEVRDNPVTSTLDSTNTTLQQHGTIFRAWRCGTCTQAGSGSLAIKQAGKI